MNFKNFYKTIEKVKYLQYEIDDDFNFLIFKELENILKLSLKYNLNLSIIGTLACIFHTNKIYRTIGDIDILVSLHDLKDWIYYINKYYNFKYTSTNLLYKSIPNFIKEQIKNENGILFVKKDNPKINIELFPIKNKQNNDKFFILPIDNYNIKYRLPYKYKKYQKNHFYDRQKDKDDIIFYSRYLKYPEDFLNL